MNKHGFTLIEMLTVVLIIGILTAVVLPQYRRAIQKAEASEAIAMLRVIHDSGERLAAEFGYKTLNDMATGEDAGKITFKRMDMFDETTIKCAIAAETITCDHFKFLLNKNGNLIAAQKLNNPYAGVEIRLSRDALPKLSCGKGTGATISDADVTKACDLYNLN